MMKELLNKTCLDYLGERMHGMLPSNDEINILGNAISLIAYYGDMPEMKNLAHFVGMGHRKFTREVQDIIYQFYDEEIYLRDRDQNLWRGARASKEEFLIAMAAGLIEFGYWVETPKEPRERAIARQTLAQIAPATIVRTRSELKGYLAVIEFLWFSACGDELTPKAWIRQRYGARSHMKQRVDAYLDILAMYSGRDSSKLIMPDLKQQVLQNWRQEDTAIPPEKTLPSDVIV